MYCNAILSPNQTVQRIREGGEGRGRIGVVRGGEVYLMVRGTKR